MDVRLLIFILVIFVLVIIFGPDILSAIQSGVPTVPKGTNWNP